MADNVNSNHEEEVDLFDLGSGTASAPAEPAPEFCPVVMEMETNVFSVEQEPPKPGVPSPAPTDDDDVIFDTATKPIEAVSAPSNKFAGLGDDDDDDLPDLPDDDLDDLPDDDGDDFPAPKVGFFARLFGGKAKDADDLDDDLPDLPDDDDDDLDDLPDLPDDDDDLPEEEDFSDLNDLPDGDDGDTFDLSAAAPAAAQEEEFDLSAAAPAAAQEEEFDLSAVTPAPEPTVIDPGPDPVFGKIAHVCLHVKNLETSVEYYTKLGFKKRFLFKKDGKHLGIYLEFGKGNFVELFEDASLEYSKGRMTHFCLETPDIDAVMESLSRRGIEHTPKKFGCDGTYQTWLKDPDGNRFEIHQYTAESSQVSGRDVEADW